MSNYGDWQFGIYLDGLTGKRPALPMSYAELERQAEKAMSAEMWSYVAGGAGDERTQRANVRAFEGWGLMPRMLTAAAERDLSVELFGRRLATPLLLAPVGVIGLCAEDGHGDLAAARAAAATGVPMVASTLTEDPMEAVAAELGQTPGWFQLYPPADRELCESLVRSGADVVTALALGARAVGIGRPYAYGLALGGQAGIEHVLRCMLAELDLIMAVDGYRSLAALDRDALRRVR